MDFLFTNISLWKKRKKRPFLVIDGQQRLMSIYYFIKMRFPKKKKESNLENIFDRRWIPEKVIHEDSFFGPFNLNLPEKLPGQKNKLHNLNYATLDNYKELLITYH